VAEGLTDMMGEPIPSSKPGFGAKILQKIVKNEAMTSDPPEIYGWRVFALSCSACFGGMLFGFDIGTIGGVLILPPFMKSVNFYRKTVP
jgi:hypothetical protein